MSAAYPSTFSQHQGEVEQWYNEIVELAQQWKGAAITADSGIQPCRLAPVYPLGAAIGSYWWPLPGEIRELQAAVKHLSDLGMIYDTSRKTVPGFERSLKISLSGN